VDVTANRDATLTVSEHEIPLRRLYEQGYSQSSDKRATVELMTPRKTWLHVTVEDATTGRPTPVRIHFRSPDGRHFPPYGIASGQCQLVRRLRGRPEAGHDRICLC